MKLCKFYQRGVIFLKKFLLLFSLLTITLTGCSSEETIVQSYISYYEGSIAHIDETSITIKTPDNTNITFQTSKKSDTKEIELDDIVYIECEENNVSDIKNLVKITKLENSIDITYNPRMVFVNDYIYIENLPIYIEVRPGIIDGIIDTAVMKNEKPGIHNQSNFGIGYEYKLIDEKRIDVNIDGQWIRFIKLSNDIIYYNNLAFYKKSLSPETLEWLIKYNKLTEKEKSKISFVPSELAPSQISLASELEVVMPDMIIETDNDNKIFISINSFNISETGESLEVLIDVDNTGFKDYELKQEDITLLILNTKTNFVSPVMPDESSDLLGIIEKQNSKIWSLKFNINLLEENDELYLKTNTGMFHLK